MKVSKYEFASKFTSCDRYRRFKNVEVVAEKSMAYDNAVGMMDVIRAICWDKTESIDDIFELASQVTGYDLDLANSDTFSAENESRKMRAVKKARQYKRYCEGELKKNRDNLMITLQLPEREIMVGNYEISTRPQALFLEKTSFGYQMEAVFYKDKKAPTGVNRTPALDAEIQKWDEAHKPVDPLDPNRLKYVRFWADEYLALKWIQKTLEDPDCLELLGIPKGENVTGIGAVYYMEFKSADTNYEEYFVEGSNVAELCEAFTAGEPKDKSTFVDEIFLNYADMHYTGITAESCSADDCKWCSNRASCGFQKSPKKLEKSDEAGMTNANLVFEPTEAQKELVNLKSGYHLCIARAGSGKTASMKNLVLQLVKDGADLSKILMTTFTKNGVKEFKDRLTVSLRKENKAADVEAAHICTFHGFALEIIRDNFEECGYTAPPREINEVDEARIISDLIAEHKLTGPSDLYKIDFEGVVNALKIAIRVFHMHAEHPEYDSNDIYSHMNVRDKDKVTTATISEILALYPDFLATLQEENIILFSQMESLMHAFLEKHPDYIEETYGFEYVILDEFQDSNDIQMATVKLLSDCKCVKMIVAVGDDGQSIYGFRDANVDNIINFEQKLGKPVHQIRMLENWRSTPEILELADNFLDLNENKTEGHAIAGRPASGIKPVVMGFHSQAEEYAWILEMIEKVHESGVPYYEIVIIARTNKELVKFIELLSAKGIPYVMKNPICYSDNSRVKAATALYDNVFHQPETNAGYFAYLAAKYDGDMFLNRTPEEIREEMEAMAESMKNINDMTFEAQRAIMHKLLDDIRGEDEIYISFLDEYLYKYPDIEEELLFVEDFKKFGSKMAKRMEGECDGLVLTTAHSSKGLEYSVVFNPISGYDSKILHMGKRQSEVEEERRLLYVSMTRAKDQLYVTGRYMIDGTKSREGGPLYNRFLEELMTLNGQEYDPTDPKKKPKKGKDKAVAVSPNVKSREMTDEEKRTYRKRVLGSYQSTLPV